jgi:hypothetical protein
MIISHKILLSLFSLVFFFFSFFVFFNTTLEVTFPQISLLFLLYILNLIFWGNGLKKLNFLSLILLIFIILASFFTKSFHENDYYRYQLDGIHLLNQVDPYDVSPTESPLINNYSDLIKNVGFPEVPTIYPPFIISIFAVLNSLFSREYFLFSSRLLYLFIFFVSLYLVKKRLPSHWPYFLIHPLILIEGVINAHFDLILGGLTLLILYSTSFALLIIPIATSIKYTFFISSVLFLKDFLRNLKKGYLLLLGILLSSIPFFFFNFNLTALLRNLKFFSSEWEMNSGAFRWMREILLFINLNLENSIQVALSSSFIFFGIFFTFIIFKKNISRESKFFLIMNSFILLSPVVNPWYFLWTLPATFYMNRDDFFWGNLFYIGVPLYYVNFMNSEMQKEFLITSLNLQHAWYWTVLFFFFRRTQKNIEKNESLNS